MRRPESVTGRLAHTLTLMSMVAWSLLPNGMAMAAPQDGQVVGGEASISQQGVETVIHQQTHAAAIDWRGGFNTSADEVVRFLQPGETSRILNLVSDGRMTEFHGQLYANGQVYIANPNGIFFGGQAVVNTAQLIAAAGSIAVDNFMAENFTMNNYDFVGLTGDVVNHGSVEADTVYLIGQHVRNYGSITATDGLVMMLAGDEVYLSDNKSPVLIKVSPDDGEPGVLNAGTVDVGKGKALFSAADAYSLAVRNEGTVRGKEIEISAPGSQVQVAGLLDATDEAWAHERNVGGSIHIVADEVMIADGATLDASGGNGGGQVHIGGGVQGAGEYVAQYTYVGDAVLRADATYHGDAGEVIVWAEHSTWFYGTASAVGGTEGGHGGLIEVSGLRGLDARGQYDLSAANGVAGTLLFDPIDIVIVGSASGSNPEAGALQIVDEHGHPVAPSLASLPSLEGFRITESRLESGEFSGNSAQVVLDARRSITVEGEFTDSDGDGKADFVLDNPFTTVAAPAGHICGVCGQVHDVVPVGVAAAGTLILTTHNTFGDGAGTIDLAGSGAEPLQLIVRNGAGLKVLAATSGEAAGNVRLGHVTTEDGRVDVVTNRGSIDAMGHIHVGASFASLHATDDLNVHGNVTAYSAVLHAASDSSGQLNLGEMTVHADSVHLWAGDAGRAYYNALQSGDEYTSAAGIGDLSNARFTSRDGTSAPIQFLYRQDADVHTDALPQVSQFGNGDPTDGADAIDGMYYLLQSAAGSVELHNTRKIMHSSLDIWGETGVWIGNSMEVDNLYVGTNGSILVGRDVGAEIIVVDDVETEGEIFGLVVDSEGDLILGDNVELIEDTWLWAENLTFGGYVTSGVHPAFSDFGEADEETMVLDNPPAFPVVRPTNPDDVLDFTSPYFGPYHLNIWARGGVLPVQPDANGDLPENTFVIGVDANGNPLFVQPFGGEINFNGALGNLYDVNGSLVADPVDFLADDGMGNPSLPQPLALVTDAGVTMLVGGDEEWVAFQAAQAIQMSRAGLLTLTVRSHAARNPFTNEVLVNEDGETAFDPGLIVFNANEDLVNITNAMHLSLLDALAENDPIPVAVNINLGGPLLRGEDDELASPGIRTVGGQQFGHPADNLQHDNLMVINDETRFIPQGGDLMGLLNAADINSPNPLSPIPGPQPDGTWGNDLLIFGDLVGTEPPSLDQPFAPPTTGRVPISLGALTFVLNFTNGTNFTLDYNQPIPPAAPAADVTGQWIVGDMDINSFINTAGVAVGQLQALIDTSILIVREAYEQIPTTGQDPRSPIPDGQILNIAFWEIGDWLGLFNPNEDTIPEHYFVNIGSNIGTFSVPGLLGIASEVGAVRNQHPEDPNVIDNIGPNVWYEQLPNGTIISHPVPPGSVVATVFTDQAEGIAFPLGQPGFLAASRFVGNIIAHEVAHTLGARHTDSSTSVTPNGFPDIMSTPATDAIFDRMEFSFTGIGNDTAFPAPPSPPVYVSTVGTEITNIDILFGALGSQFYPDNAVLGASGISVDIADATVFAPGDVTFFGNVTLNQVNVDNDDSFGDGAILAGTGTLIIGGDVFLRSALGFNDGVIAPFSEFRLNGDITEVVTFRHSAVLFVGVESVVPVYELITGLEIGVDVFGTPLPATIVDAQDVSINALNDYNIDGTGQLVLTNRDRNGIPFADHPDGFTLTIKADNLTTFDQANSFSNDGLPGTLVLLPRILNVGPLGAPVETADPNIGINSGGFFFNVDADFFTGVTGTTAANPFNIIVGTEMDPFTGVQSAGDVTIGAIVGGTGVINFTLYGNDLTFTNSLTLAEGSTVNFHLTGGVTPSGGTDLAMTNGIGTLNLFADGNVTMATDISQLSVANTGPGTSIENAAGLNLVSVSNTGNLFIGTSNADADISDSGPVVVGGDALFITGGVGADIMLDQLAVTGLLGVVTLDGNATLTNSLPINFDLSFISGNLTATSTTGGITQSAALLVNDPGDMASFNAAAGFDVTLTNPGNDFDTVAFTGRNVTVNDLTALTFGGPGSLITNNLTAFTGGNMLFDPGSVGVAGLATLNSGADIDFGSGLTFGSLDATAANDIMVDTMNVTGLAMLDSGATLDFLDTLTAGSLDATAVNDLMLMPGSLLIGGDAALRSTAGAIDTADNADGDAELTAGGAVTLQGIGIGATNPIEVAGSGGGQMLSLINIGAGTDDITVDVLGTAFTALDLTHADVGSNATVDFTATGDMINLLGGAVASLDGIDLSSSILALGFELTQLNGVIDIGLVNMGANALSVTSNDGNITNSDSILSMGMVTLDSGTADTTLNNVGNDFNMVTATANQFDLTDINSVTLNTTVNQLGVNLTGLGGTATVTETNAVTIDNSVLDGNTLNFSAGGAVTVAGSGLSIAGGTLNLASTASSIDVNDTGIAAAGSTVTLNATTAINGMTDNDTADITADVMNLFAPQVGTPGTHLDVAVATSFNAQVGSDLFVDGIGDLPIGFVQAAGSDVNISSTGDIVGASPNDYFPDIRSSHITLTAANIGPLELFNTTAFASDVTGTSFVRFLDGRPGSMTFIGGGSFELAIVTNPVTALPGEPASAESVSSRFYVVHPDGEGAPVDWLGDLEPEGGAATANLPRPLQYGAQRFGPRTLGRLMVVTGRTTVDFSVIHQTVFNRYVGDRQYPSLLGNVPFSADDYIAYLRRTATIGLPGDALDAAIVLDGLREFARNLELQGLYAPGYDQARLNSLAPHAPVGMSAADLEAAIRVLVMLDRQTIAQAN